MDQLLERVVGLFYNFRCRNNLEFIYPREPNKFRGYCIFKKTLDDTNLNKYEYYYVVVTFSRLNVGVSNVGTIFKRPVSGETKIYYLY